MLRQNKLFAVGFAVCLFWVAVAFVAPLIAPYEPLAQDMSARFVKPCRNHLCGTDSLGRDVLSRVIWGSRISIEGGVLTIIFASLVGIVYGGAAGFAGGLVDEIMMRFCELVQAFPTIILAMVISTALGPSLFHTLLAMVIVWWPNYARVMRSMVIQV
ncbi:MAG: ABC transporter permease, partial [Spirochaetaceae bacterium]|nr:ABC transporter permease [Spirochaetaceae bacterium]